MLFHRFEPAQNVVRQVDRDADHHAVIELQGEIDLATVDQLHSVVADTLAPPPATLLLDASKVGFIDSTGISAVLSTHRQCTALGVTLTVVHSPALQRVILAMGLDDVFPDARPLHPTT